MPPILPSESPLLLPPNKSHEPNTNFDLQIKHCQHCAHDFIPIRTLGRGAMGIVLLVVHRESMIPFALKVVNKEAMGGRRSTDRAQTEIDVLAKLHHPFLSTLHSHFESASSRFLVLDYYVGGDLNVLRQRQPDKIFSEAAIRFYGAELVLALEHLHKLGIVYRDLKPENVLLSDTGHIVLTDFDLSLILSPQTRIDAADVADTDQVMKHNHGPSFLFSCFGRRFTSKDRAIACAPKTICAHPRRDRELNYRGRSPSRASPTQAKDRQNSSVGAETAKYFFVGTDEYVAPEILLGTDHDFTVDWWALGVLLHELFYGRTPFKGLHRKSTFYNILHKEPDISGRGTLQDLIRKLLVKDKHQRLGYGQGAKEVKKHSFFKGVQWESLQHVARPPIVPGSMSAQDIMYCKGNQVSSDLETYLAAMETSSFKAGTCSSRSNIEQSSDEETMDSDSESF